MNRQITFCYLLFVSPICSSEWPDNNPSKTPHDTEITINIDTHVSSEHESENASNHEISSRDHDYKVMQIRLAAITTITCAIVGGVVTLIITLKKCS